MFTNRFFGEPKMFLLWHCCENPLLEPFFKSLWHHCENPIPIFNNVADDVLSDCHSLPLWIVLTLPEQQSQTIID